MQKIETKIVELKNKRFVTIRQAEIDDAERLLKCIKKYVPQSAYIPKLAQEIKLPLTAPCQKRGVLAGRNFSAPNKHLCYIWADGFQSPTFPKLKELQCNNTQSLHPTSGQPTLWAQLLTKTRF